MKKKSLVGKVLTAATAATTAVTVGASNAMAAMDFTTFDVDTSHVETLTVAIVAGLATIWAIRKIIKLVNRS